MTQSHTTLNIADAFPHAVRELRHVWIPMPDGVHLAARIWLPDDAEQKPVPAIVESIPYRKNDSKAQRDSIMHPYFAGHGYAAVRVDLRGSGDSEGVLTDEYLERELSDGEAVLRWLDAQPWCNGAIGIIGISWGGFHGLQLAYRQPKQLKAVVTVCSTDDRYADDVHYMGGCLLGDNLSWASTMFSYNTAPPDPATVGEKWREMWFERLRGSGLWLETWLEHQHRNEYWKHGSICEDWARVQTPVLAASGWADGYTNAVFRMMKHLRCPRLGLVGPWSHKYPHQGVPGPAIGFLQECLRWWDYWLKDMETGIMAEPMLRVWIQDPAPPHSAYRVRHGRWVSEPAWPSPHVVPRRYGLKKHSLFPLAEEPGRKATAGEALADISPLSVGLFAGKWCSFASAPDLPGDQREEDGGALVFESEPLEQPLEILGQVVVDLDVEVDQPVAMICARLSELRADRKATRLSYGLQNLCHRNSHEQPEPLEPGKRYKVRIRLNDVGHRFGVGHRMRISISTSYWPLAWPPPRQTRLIVHTAGSTVTFPVRPAEAPDGEVTFGPPEGAAPLPVEQVEPEHHSWRVIRDLEHDHSVLEVTSDEGVQRLPDIDMTMRRNAREWYSFVGDDFESARGETRYTRSFERGNWVVHTTTRTVLTCSADAFHLQAELDAHEGDTRVYSRNWDRRIPRKLL